MRLPYDVLVGVIQQLDPTENAGTSATLASLCLVSKEINTVATRVLWEKVRTDDEEKEAGGGEGGETGKKQPAWMKAMQRECEYDLQKKEWQKLKSEGKTNEHEFWPDEAQFDYEDDYEDNNERYGYESEERGGPKFDQFRYAPSDVLDPFSYQQVLALESFPHLTQHVKVIDFRGRLEGKVTSKVFERLLEVCPNVSTVLLQRAEVRYLLEEGLLVVKTLINHAKNLTRLELIDFDDEGSTQSLLSDLAKLPKLQHLSITCKPHHGREWCLTNYTSELPAPLPQHFKSLHIGSTLDDEFLPFFASSSIKSLNSLGVTVRRETPDLSAYKNLEHLTITFDKVDRATETLRTLSLETKITTLELRWSERVAAAEYREYKFEVGSDDEFEGYDESGSEGEEEEEVKPIEKPVPCQKPVDPLVLLLKAIPSTVHTLSFPYSLYHSGDNVEKDFEKAFESDSVPSNLRKVCLVAAPEKYISKEEEEEMLEDDYVDYEEEDRKEQEEWLTKMGKVLEKKGIDLLRVPDWSKVLDERSFMARLSGGKKNPN